MSWKLAPGERYRMQIEDCFVLLTSGRVEAYAVACGKESFRQEYLMELKAGEAAFSSMDEFGAVEIVLYALTDAELEELSGPASGQEHILLIHRWLMGLLTVPWLRLLADRGDDLLTAWQRETFLQDATSSDEFWEEFQRNMRIFSALCAARFQSEDIKNSRRIQVRKKRQQRRIENTIALLLGEQEEIPDTGENQNEQLDEVTFLARSIAQALSMPTKNMQLQPLMAKRLDQQGMFRRLIQKGNMQMRLVTLEQGWHHKDCGVLLGYYGQEKNLAAFLPNDEKSYRMVTWKQPEGRVVKEEDILNIDREAFACHAGLPARKLKKKDILRFVYQHSWNVDWRTIILTSFLAGLIPLLTPIITETIFQDIIPIQDRQGLATIAQIAMVSGFTLSALSIVRSIAMLRLGTDIDIAMETALFGRMLSLPTSFFRRFSTGELASRFKGLETAKQILFGNFSSQAFEFLFSFWSLLLMCWYSLPLTAVAVVLWIITGGCNLWLVWRMLRFQRGLTAARNSTAGILQQIFTGLTKFRVHGAEEQAYHLWGRAFAVEWQQNLSLRWQYNWSTILGTIQPILLTLLMFYVVMYHVNKVSDDGQILQVGISYASFLAFQSACTGFNSALNRFLAGLGQFLAVQPQLENLRPFLEEEPESMEDRMEAGALSGAIEVRELTFSYSDGGRNILNGVSFRIRAGESVAIVGRSGCGKSTLIRLLMGFECPKRGGIYYDGQDLAELSLPSVRAQLGVVLQNGQLMSGDIYTNIAGTNALTQEQAWEAAEAAGVAEDIRNMPMGLQTIISEESSNISGGQRQRILIARALAAKPAIIIFDEATSALDNRSQAIVTESLERLRATRIVVAHRLSTIQNADRILVMDQGRIVESGSYEELMAQEGLFADLARRQIA